MDDSPATRRTLIVKLRDPADSVAWGEFVASTSRWFTDWLAGRAFRTPMRTTSARRSSRRWPGPSIAGSPAGAPSAAGCRGSPATC